MGVGAERSRCEHDVGRGLVALMLLYLHLLCLLLLGSPLVWLLGWLHGSVAVHHRIVVLWMGWVEGVGGLLGGRMGVGGVVSELVGTPCPVGVDIDLRCSVDGGHVAELLIIGSRGSLWRGRRLQESVGGRHIEVVLGAASSGCSTYLPLL